MKLVSGKGIYEKGEFKATENGKVTREYNLWTSMLERAYCMKYREKRPNYEGAEVSDSWLHFQQFAKDINDMIGFNSKDGKRHYSLDKDLLFEGNKKYSKENCVFLPNKINTFISQERDVNNLGVYPIYNRFKALITVDGKVKNLGHYEDVEDAKRAYNDARIKYRKELAEKYKNQIDERAYKKLSDV